MIYVIETHADDAFLSLGGHIEQWVKEDKHVIIITVYSGTRRRAHDASNYAVAVGARWEGLGFEEAGGGLKAKPDTEYADKIAEELDKIIDSRERILSPLAIGHPEHEIVKAATAQYEWAGSNLQYYLDAPYMLTHKLNENINKALRGMQVVSYLKPNVRKWRHIPLFKDQSLFFHRNPVEKLQQCFELIVAQP